MKFTIKMFLATLALFLLTPGTLIRSQAAPPAVPMAREQSTPFEGTWEGVELGREAEGKCTMTVTGNALHFQGSNPQEWYKATFTLPAGTDPKQLRATITDCPQPDYIGKVSLAIFKIEAGTLTLVGHEPGASNAPKSFKGDEDSRTIVFKKAQPPKR